MPDPVAFVRPAHQYAVRTPSEEKPDGSSAIVCTSRRELDRQRVVAHCDARAGMEADLKSDQRGWAWRFGPSETLALWG